MKKSQVILTGFLAVTISVIWNGALFVDWQKTSAPWNVAWRSGANNRVKTIDSQEPVLWQAIKKTVVNESPDSGFDPQFDDAVIALNGKVVELPGVGFLLSSGLGETEKGEEEVTEFLLLPSHGGVAWCCGLSPIANHEFSVLVDCHNAPFSPSKIDPKNPAFFVNVRGTLRLQQSNTLNALYTLDDATIEFIDVQDILPLNVKNLCLNQPLNPNALTRQPNPNQPQQPNQTAQQDSP